ncbi:MAG: hypothetical protein IKZ87_00170 [Actinomycetaceae bacterium]|nr:hypothetical protein [Actinomycetaceae bacterium]
MTTEKDDIIEIAEYAAGEAQEWADCANGVCRQSKTEVFMCASHTYDYMRVANYCNNAVRTGNYPLRYVLQVAKNYLESAHEAEETEATCFDETYDDLTGEMAAQWAQKAQEDADKLRRFLSSRRRKAA